MTIQERKNREKEALKSKILEQAEKIMADTGIEHLSMRKIAGAIDYSPTTIYRFFKDKNSLLSTIVSRNHSEITKRFKSVTDDDTLDPLQKLKRLIKEYIGFSLDYSDTYKLYTSICKFEVTDNGLYEIIDGKSYRVFSSWQTQIDSLISKGQIQNTRSINIILQIWHVTHGFISNRIHVKNIPWKSNDEEIDEIIELIFNGIIIKQ